MENELKNNISKSERINKRRSDLLEKLNEIPDYNSNTIDFEKTIIDFRTLYKQCGMSFGLISREFKSMDQASETW
jgi:hypothetical protein